MKKQGINKEKKENTVGKTNDFKNNIINRLKEISIGDWINSIIALFTFISLILVGWSIVEMRRDRDAAYRPSLLMNPVEYSVTWNDEGEEPWLSSADTQVEEESIEAQEDGTVNVYQVKNGDITGYVYGKYMVFNEEDAKANYNAEVYDPIHSAIKNSYGGGEAINLDFYPVDKPKFEDNVMPEAVYSLYLNSGVLGSVDEYIAFAKETKINAFVFDQYQNGYYKIGEKVGQAWKSGEKFMNK